MMTRWNREATHYIVFFDLFHFYVCGPSTSFSIQFTDMFFRFGGRPMQSNLTRTVIAIYISVMGRKYKPNGAIHSPELIFCYLFVT